MEMTKESPFKEIQRDGYSSLALYKISDGAVNYIVLGISENDAMRRLEDHFDDMGMIDELEDYDEIKMHAANDPVNIRYPDHDLEITLKAKEWSAVFDANRPEWGIVGCSEWA